MLKDIDGFLKSAEDVDTAAFGRAASMDHAAHYVTYLMFDRIYSLNLNLKLYSKRNDLSTQSQYVLGHGQLY